MKLLTFIAIFNSIFFIYNADDFSYSSQTEWGKLCTSGQNQSPIQINPENVDTNAEDSFQLLITEIKNQQDATIENDGSTISSSNNWVCFTASDVRNKLRTYEAESIKFHSPAEHTIKNIQPDLELQIISKQTSGFADDKEYGILSLLFVEAAGEDNKMLKGFQTFIELILIYIVIDLKRNKNAYGSKYQDINLQNALFPLLSHYNSSLNYYTYQGSLTTPPCSETVNWYIIKNYFPVSSYQLKLFQSFWSGNQNFAAGAGNNRDLQSVNNREIAYGKAFVSDLSSVLLTGMSCVFAVLMFGLLI